MGRRRDSKNDIRKLARHGTYSYHITLPKREIDHLGWREKQKLVVRRSGKHIVITDWKP